MRTRRPSPRTRRLLCVIKNIIRFFVLNFSPLVEDPLRRRWLQPGGPNSRWAGCTRSRLPMGRRRGRQRGPLRFRQAPTNARPNVHGRAEGAHERGPVRELPVREVVGYGRHAGHERVQGDQVSSRLFETCPSAHSLDPGSSPLYLAQRRRLPRSALYTRASSPRWRRR